MRSTEDRAMRSRIGSARRLITIYIAALCMVGISITVSMTMGQMVAKELYDDATHINDTGRLRMLSQRIMYLSQDIVLREDVENAEARARLDGSITLFQDGLDQFAAVQLARTDASDGMSEAVRLFVEDGPNGPLEARLTDYIALARQILTQVEARDTLEQMRQIEQTGTLLELDRIVDTLEQVSQDRIQRLLDIEVYSILLAIFIILLEIVFVFLPGHRTVTTLLRDLSRANSELTENQLLVDLQSDALERRNKTIETEGRRLEAAYAESETLRKEQVEFTKAITHNMKSPANTLHMLLAELDREDRDRMSKDGREMLDLGRETVDRMRCLVEDVLAYSRTIMEPAVPELIDMEELQDRIMARFPLAAGQITWDCQADLVGHPDQLAILLHKLISNGLKYQDGTRPPKVHVRTSLSADGATTCIAVRDNGIGIRKQDQDMIFKLFQRLNPRDAFSGNGIGLATVERVVEGYDGTISVTSDVGKGSTFTVSLPRSSAPATRSNQAAA